MSKRKRAPRPRSSHARDAAVSPNAPRLASAPGLVVVVDTRESTPYDFASINVPSVRATLSAGDYSCLGHETSMAIERKELSDAVKTIIGERERFERELDRARGYDFFAILIEGSVEDVLAYRPPPSSAAWSRLSAAQIEAQPRSVINSLNKYMVEYGVHVIYASKDRAICRALVLRLAERYWRKHHPVDLSGIVRAHREREAHPRSPASSSSSPPSPENSPGNSPAT